MVLGAAGERTIPGMDGQAPELAADEETEEDEDEDEDEAPAAGRGRLRWTTSPGTAREPPGGVGCVARCWALLVLLLVLAAGLGAAYAWIRTQFYVGAAGEQVAIYQGLADALPAIPLSRVYKVEPLALAELPPHYQDVVRANIEVDSLAAARATVAELKAEAERCATTARPRPPPRPAAGRDADAGSDDPAGGDNPPAGDHHTGRDVIPAPPTARLPTPTSSASGGPVAPEC